LKRNLRLEKLEKKHISITNPPPTTIFFQDGICEDGTGRTPAHDDFKDYPNGDMKFICVDYV